MKKKEELKHENKMKKRSAFKALKKKFSKLSTGKKVQAIIASVFTLALLIILPVYAWFALGGKLEAFTKIKEPDNLDIRAGHYDNVQYFNLNDIDIEKIAGENGVQTPHMVVFSVSAGDYKIPYQLQLAHTTNIPFKYRIYRAKEWDSAHKPANPDVTYISEPLKNQGATEEDYTFYYTKVGDAIDLAAINADNSSLGTYGRTLALGGGTYYDKTYDDGDEPEVYAVPIYEQSGEIRYDPTSDHDYFILEISWDNTVATSGNFSEWNVHENKKETDMIYLTASRYSQ